MKMNEKFVIEMDEAPKLLFISKSGKGMEDELYVNGKKVTGERSIRIYSAYDEPTTHEIEYLTMAVRDNEEPE